MASDHDQSAGDSLLRIEINPPLPCGIGSCGQLARCARIERDPRYDSLWRLLPICEAHLRALDAAGRSATQDNVAPAVGASSGD